ncbi:MAG: phosphate ABC transporter permease PstA [Candidatus Heimdallarchaeota archaeon]|nr:phosphate ABC transporter permease PstA [Candidatus Heimdallarchaeota archaeon]
MIKKPRKQKGNPNDDISKIGLESNEVNFACDHECFEELPRRRCLIKPKGTQKVVYGMLWSSAGFIIIVLLSFMLLLIIKGFQGFTFKMIFQAPSEYEWSVRPAIFGTILLIIGAVVIALPLGLSAAIYLTEYAKKGNLINFINQGINNLAGVPSIVFGIFGYAFFCIALGMGRSLYAGWLTLACMILPTIIRTSEEALKGVPHSYREGSLALGATKWRTIRHIVLPTAAPGITTGVILALGRAAGETAAILFVGGSIVPGFLGFDSPFGALSIYLYLMAISAPASTRNIQWAIALILIIVVFSFNAGAIVLRNRTEKRSRQ